jgi:hypothetical protein
LEGKRARLANNGEKDSDRLKALTILAKHLNLFIGPRYLLNAMTDAEPEELADKLLQKYESK